MLCVALVTARIVNKLPETMGQGMGVVATGGEGTPPCIRIRA